MKTIRKVLITVCCAALLISGFIVSAKEAMPEQKENPTWKDTFEFRAYIGAQIYELYDAGKLDYYENDSQKEDLNLYADPKMWFASAPREHDYELCDREFWDVKVENEEDKLDNDWKGKYDKLYAAGKALLESRFQPEGTYYITDILPEWERLGAASERLDEKVRNGSIRRIADDEERPEDTEWVLGSALDAYYDACDPMWKEVAQWDEEKGPTRQQMQDAINVLKAALEELKRHGNFTLDLPQSTPGTDAGSTSSDRNNTTAKVPKMWKPTTPDEIKRYACWGRETIQITQASGNAYPVKMVNIMQGPMCFDSFEAVLGDYTIGRTYDIYPYGNKVYDADQKVELTIKIPEAIYNANREYKMICVTKDGKPIIYDDLDKNSETITIRTNTFYAYALIYK